MKFCERCYEEIGTKDGENLCSVCEGFRQAGLLAAERKKLSAAKARARRKEREAILRDCGLVKVRGALGGTYWE